MSNDNVSAVEHLFNECKKDNRNLNKIDIFINECRCNNEDMNTMFTYYASRYDIWMLTSLHMACYFDHHEIVKKLLDSNNHFQFSVHVNSINVNIWKKNGYSPTPLDTACNKNFPLTVRALLQHPNVIVNNSFKYGLTSPRKDIVIELLKHRDIQVTVKDEYGWIPLHYACKYQPDDIRLFNRLSTTKVSD